MAGGSRKVFISYARSDARRVGALVEGLRQLSYNAWLDEELTGGQVWWDAILSQIRDSSVVLVAVSAKALESVAVRREYEYGHAVGRPLLPVVVGRVRLEMLPSLLARLQVVDYRKPGVRSAFALAAALAHLPAPQALPQPLPNPPPIPVANPPLFIEHSQAATLTMEQQLALIARLKVALDRASEREAAEEVLRSLQNRDDLYEASTEEIESLLSSLNRQLPARRRDRDRYARDAVEEILHGVEDRFSLRRPAMEEEDDYDKADELVRLFYHQAVYIPEPAIRSLIEEAARFLDYRARLAEVGVDLREIVYQVRRMLHEVLGSWLRGEEIPALEPRYIKIRDELDKLPKRPIRAKEDIGNPASSLEQTTE